MVEINRKFANPLYYYCYYNNYFSFFLLSIILSLRSLLPIQKSSYACRLSMFLWRRSKRLVRRSTLLPRLSCSLTTDPFLSRRSSSACLLSTITSPVDRIKTTLHQNMIDLHHGLARCFRIDLSCPDFCRMQPHSEACPPVQAGI